MGLTLRIFAGYFLVIGVGLIVLFYTTVDHLGPALRQTSEDALVETANLLAELVEPELFEVGEAENSVFAEAVARYRARQPGALIWDRLKETTDLVIYVTDHRGQVVFHTSADQIGSDYSGWRDVQLTLQDRYGARTTPVEPSATGSTMYVAAPVRHDDRVVGVLTVGQPIQTTQAVLDSVRGDIVRLVVAILLLALGMGAVISIWLTRSIRSLLQYVEAVRNGRPARLPVIREPELARLAVSTEAMRREIEGRKYVEQYVHNLTHEMKSPISAIRGAVEILADDPAPDARARFLRNIDRESSRMQRLTDRLLSLATLENRHETARCQLVDAVRLVRDEITAKRARIDARNLQIECDFPPRGRTIEAEHELLVQAVSNLLDNAIEFCPVGGQLAVAINEDGKSTRITIFNTGEHVPDYALPRLFERFYSLPRPDSGDKSTGLGLSFVHQIVKLHDGSIDIQNVPGGVQAILSIPFEKLRQASVDKV